jgi:hypothetical protein
MSGGSCVAFTVCPAGSYVVQAGTAATDQICDLCPSGSFSTDANSASCTPWRTCQPGTYVVNVPSTTADRTCASCGSGTYTNGVNQSYCLGAAQCPAGTVETAPGTTTSAQVCTPCSTGEYCAGGTNQAVACTGEKWDDDASPATACVAKTVCAPGTSVARSGSAKTDRVCAPCGGGSFSTTQNAANCSGWSSCAPGTFVVNLPTATTDRQCAPCPADTFTKVENQSTCLSINDCPAGTTVTSPGTTTAAPECGACLKGEYCPGGDIQAKPCPEQTWDHDGNPATACVLWSSCPPGSYIASTGSTTIDQSCLPCPDGRFSASMNNGFCSAWLDCPPGTYVASPPTAQADRSCMLCDPGTFAAQNNQNSCAPWGGGCAANTEFVSLPGTATTDVGCSPCSANGCAHYCSEAGACLDCISYTDCASGLACVKGTCKDLGCGGGAYFKETFLSGNAQWWTVDSPWDIGPAVAWSGPAPGGGTYPDPTADHTQLPGGDNMLAGVVIGGIAPLVVMDQPSYLTSAAIDISSGPSPVYLEFYRWLNSDVPPFMNNSVEVFDGSQWVTLWSGPPSSEDPLAENAWSHYAYNVTAYRNPYFRVRFGYIVENATAYAVGSWNVDDIRIANTLSCTAAD